MGEWYNIFKLLPQFPLCEVSMKRFIGILAVMVLVLALTSPVLAASLGVSPSSVEIEIPGDGSATADFQVHYFSGDVQVSLVDIPLRVEPEVLYVDALDEPVDVQLTIYGDESLGSQVYNGYIKFLGMTGETVAIAVQVKAKINHIVAGQPLPPETPAAENLPPEATPAAQGGIGGLPLSTVIIIAGGLVFLGLIALSISLVVRRAKY
jgi:hypothetical protein